MTNSNYSHNPFVLLPPTTNNVAKCLMAFPILPHAKQALQHHDPGTSDDSGRASERLTTSSVAPRDADSSRDRLSDVRIQSHTPCQNVVPNSQICNYIRIALLTLTFFYDDFHRQKLPLYTFPHPQASSRCSSGKGYIVSVQRVLTFV